MDSLKIINYGTGPRTEYYYDRFPNYQLRYANVEIINYPQRMVEQNQYLRDF